MIRTLLLQLTRAATALQTRWLNGPPAAPRQRIYCVNHTSHLDTVLALAALRADGQPLPLPVAAAHYWQHGRVRRWLCARVFPCIRIERESRALNPLAPVFAALRAGESILFFPEGTRGPGGAMRPLKPGAYFLARAFPHVDIVPVWIDNAHRVLPKGARVPLPLPCAVTFGAPVSLQSGDDATVFLERLRHAFTLTRERAQGVPPYRAGAPVWQP